VLDAALKRRSSTTTDGLPSLTGPYFSEERHTGDESVLTRSLKPGRIVERLRGPFDKLRACSEGPLFHGTAPILATSRSGDVSAEQHSAMLEFQKGC